jgi:hypothetical protein
MDNLRLTDYLAEYDAAESRKGFSLAWIRVLIKELRKGKVRLLCAYLHIRLLKIGLKFPYFG